MLLRSSYCRSLDVVKRSHTTAKSSTYPTDADVERVVICQTQGRYYISHRVYCIVRPGNPRNARLTLMPWPSSCICKSFNPPSLTVIMTDLDPASKLFSMSSWER